ncbi:MAG: hypothetical protein MPW15_08255 [Candidatus Manganitrophus sp.]|nr:hypothetical protein [Candidatus Manganitrophus sp.]
MASAKNGYPHIVKLFEKEIAGIDPAAQRARDAHFKTLAGTLDESCMPRVHREVNRLTPTIIEVVVKAPTQAPKFEPGQFYRVQNFEIDAPVVDGTTLADGGSRVDRRLGRQGRGSPVGDRARDGHLQPALRRASEAGERVIVMGLTGCTDAHPGAQRDGRSSPAAASATRCSSRSARRCAPRATR